MKKNYYLIKSLILFYGLVLIFSLIINLFYYFDIFSNNLVKYIKLFTNIISFFISGIYLGKHSINKGYISGLKLSIIILLISIITCLIMNNFNYYLIIYYIILIICITFGSMIGINKKKN